MTHPEPKPPSAATTLIIMMRLLCLEKGGETVDVRKYYPASSRRRANNFADTDTLPRTPAMKFHSADRSHFRDRSTAQHDHLQLVTTKILTRRRANGYTHGMKTAVSIPDDVFRAAERLAKRRKSSRSELYGKALVDYIARHAADPVTETMNQACSDIGVESNEFTTAASRQVLSRVAW